jgi:hypothetical protein
VEKGRWKRMKEEDECRAQVIQVAAMRETKRKYRTRRRRKKKRETRESFKKY